MTSLVQYEPRVNDTVRVFLQRTEELYAKAGHGEACNFILWLQYFAFDVITEITYSRRVGFVDKCEDVDGIIAWLGKIFDYQAPVSEIILGFELILISRSEGWPDALARQGICEKSDQDFTR